MANEVYYGIQINGTNLKLNISTGSSGTGADIWLMPGDTITFSDILEAGNNSNHTYISSVIDYPSLSSGHYLPTVTSITDSTITGLTAHGYEQRIVITYPFINYISLGDDVVYSGPTEITCTVGGVSVELTRSSSLSAGYYYGSIAGMTGDVVVTVTGTGYCIGVWMDFGVTYNGTQRMMVANTSGEITTINKLSSEYTLPTKAYNETLLGLNVSTDKAVFSYGDIDASSSTYTKYPTGIPWVITNNDVLTELWKAAEPYKIDDSVTYYVVPLGEEQTLDLSIYYIGATGSSTLSFDLFGFYAAPYSGTDGFALYPMLLSSEDLGWMYFNWVILQNGDPPLGFYMACSTDVSFNATTSSGGTLTIGSTELTEANLIKLLALLE